MEEGTRGRSGAVKLGMRLLTPSVFLPAVVGDEVATVAIMHSTRSMARHPLTTKEGKEEEKVDAGIDVAGRLRRRRRGRLRSQARRQQAAKSEWKGKARAMEV